MPECPILPENATLNTKNFLGQYYGDLKRNLDRQLRYYASKNIDVKLMWECQYLERTKLEITDKCPLDRLVPRQALRGGRTTTLNVLFNAEDHPDRVLQYWDFNRKLIQISSLDKFVVLQRIKIFCSLFLLLESRNLELFFLLQPLSHSRYKKQLPRW